MEKLNITTNNLIIIVIILIEAFLCIRERLHDNKIKDILANICIYIANLIASVFVRGFIFLALTQISQFALFSFQPSVLTWIFLFILLDLCIYGLHYVEHKSRFLWATHSIHHSSSNFNFSVAVRSAHPNALYKLIYEIPLCLIGFDISMIITVHTLILLYGILQHTERVKKLGWLEYILNTPSHHRVHHASDEKYLDKNFGGVLIIWDKLFGTFQQEEEKPTYGLTKPIKTNNPIKIVFHEWIAMSKDILKAKSLKEGLSYAFLKPGWTPKKESPLAVVTTSTSNKKVCKECDQCSPKCLARLESIKTKINDLQEAVTPLTNIPIHSPAA